MEKPQLSFASFKSPMPHPKSAEAFQTAYKRSLDSTVEDTWTGLRRWNDYLNGYEEVRVTVEGQSLIVMGKARQTAAGAVGGPFQVVSRFQSGAWRVGVRFGTIADDFGNVPTPVLDGVGPLTLPLSDPAYFPGAVTATEWLWMKVEVDDDDYFRGEVTGVTISRGHNETAPDAGGEDYFWVRLGWVDDAGDTYTEVSGNLRTHRRGGPGAPYTVYPT